jgi:EAL domain-containing protein (putative c-di-GMP-specific phosphodiesterase class I)
MSPLAPAHPGTTLTDEHDWPEMLRTAIDGAGLRAVYQPVADLTDRTVAGYEALTRFVGYPIRNPSPWFATAHTHGRGADLQATALRTALSERPGLPDGCFLAVNVSPGVLHHPAIQRVWADEPTLTGLIVELTEPATDPGDLTAALDDLRTAGARIAVTYTAHTDLTTLAGLRPHLLKLDRTVTHDLDRDGTGRAHLATATAFADHIGARLLAQGVEHPHQLDTLTDLGIPLAQGYHLARPSRPWARLAL